MKLDRDFVHDLYQFLKLVEKCEIDDLYLEGELQVNIDWLERELGIPPENPQWYWADFTLPNRGTLCKVRIAGDFNAEGEFNEKDCFFYSYSMSWGCTSKKVAQWRYLSAKEMAEHQL